MANISACTNRPEFGCGSLLQWPFCVELGEPYTGEFFKQLIWKDVIPKETEVIPYWAEGRQSWLKSLASSRTMGG
eukprot:5317234-Ditylum_brightwellii.AAC.1